MTDTVGRLFQLSRLGLAAGPPGEAGLPPSVLRRLLTLLAAMVIDEGLSEGQAAFFHTNLPSSCPVAALDLEPGRSKVPRSW